MSGGVTDPRILDLSHFVRFNNLWQTPRGKISALQRVGRCCGAALRSPVRPNPIGTTNAKRISRVGLVLLLRTAPCVERDVFDLGKNVLAFGQPKLRPGFQRHARK